MAKLFLLHFLVSITFLCSGQPNDSLENVFKQTENELKTLQKQVFFSKKESDRIAANKQFIAVWDKIVNNSGSLNYAFDSLKEVSILTPKDKKFKLITWDFPKDDGTHAYFGYLLVLIQDTHLFGLSLVFVVFHKIIYLYYYVRLPLLKYLDKM
jgi:hypothetical protein